MSDLKDMMDAQRGLNERVIRTSALINPLYRAYAREDFSYDNITDEEKEFWALAYSRELEHEKVEFEGCFNHKWWRTKLSPVDYQNARVELVDELHFLLSQALAIGMTAEDVYRIYMEKMAVNHARQDNGYTKENKTEDDNKSIV